MMSMYEVRAILRALKAARGPAALATVVGTEGSSYRKAGARMLVLSDGSLVGGVSGGCLESDVCQRGLHVMDSGVPQLAVYDTTGEEDAIWGMGLGCQGVVRIYIEPVQGGALPPQLEFLADCLELRRGGVQAVVVCAEGEEAAQCGQRWIWPEGGEPVDLLDDADLAAQVAADAQVVRAESRSRFQCYELGATAVNVFIEAVPAALTLQLFGAGNDAIPLAMLGRQMGWYVDLADWRPAYLTQGRFPDADRLVLCRPEELPRHLTLGENAAAVVMHHHYPGDLAVLRWLLTTPVPYIGLLGPRGRTERLLHDLAGQGMILTEADLLRLHAPVGLDIGADTPEQVALSIVAEIRAVLAGRRGIPLRERFAATG